ncbi:alkaline phosphatase [Zunongwangia endophytica]|uniref:Alkaline phosphatase n=1 Tax=Zunongwangia endophytica TaxID=1808945 RepID=A0ABV8HA77_9FLAO|nr:alkaline phosphatase [Zunongwangia endophytica]MDN3594791.1 alkaline phosphatase [Zunongwangia endophytica]
MKKIFNSIFIFLFGFSVLQAQEALHIHSHNDYEQKVPFWTAYAAGASSIEADVFLKNRKLLVAHHENETQEERTLESLYLKPIAKGLKLAVIKNEPIQLMIDVKTEATSTLKQIVKAIKRYPEIIENQNIEFIISGNEPLPSEYKNYPEFISFDYQKLEPLTSEQWDRVAMISVDYKNYAGWNGKGRFTHEDLQKVTAVIEEAQSFNKPFRFWGTPDSKSAWKAFEKLGVNYINTDEPFKCASYLFSLKDRVYKNELFAEVYKPTFEHDGLHEPVKNVILLIGDGNGLSEISSSVLANNGNLTLTQLKNIGFIKTSSADDFTTDSAAAGTALATGEKTNNRAIGVNIEEKSIPNLTEILDAKGFNTAVITTDEITGATPSAFYAHQKDRGMNAEIAQDLLKSKLTFFAGGGAKYFTDQKIFDIVPGVNDIANSKADRLGFFMAEGEAPSTLKGRGNLLPETVENALTFMNSEMPFFMMVEGAQIDKFGHFNDVSGIVSEGIDFDKAISEAIQFADKNPGTLVIVTADHETSGFSIPQGNVENHLIEGDFTTHDHTATMVPVFSYGVYSDLFRGVYENNEIFNKILEIVDER